MDIRFKYKIKDTFDIEADVFEEKVVKYLIKNFYRITEKGQGYIIFREDEFSDRRRSRSDVHTRIGKGKFLFHYAENKTDVELIYMTSVSYYAFLVMLVSAFGIYTGHIVIAIIMSVFLATPILHKIMYLNEHVFKEVMEC